MAAPATARKPVASSRLADHAPSLASGFSPWEQRFFQDYARNFSKGALILIGVIKEHTIGAPRDPGASPPKETSFTKAQAMKWTGLEKRALEVVLKELTADAHQVVAKRTWGHWWHFRLQPENYARVQPRPAASASDGGQANKRRTRIKMRVSITCPRGLPCPVDELQEEEDGVLTNRGLAGSAQPPPPEANKERTRIKMRVVGQPDETPGERMAELRARLERTFVGPGKLATAPDAKLLGGLNARLNGTSLDQFQLALRNQKQFKRVLQYGWGTLYDIAEACARSREAWERAHIHRPAGPAPAADPCERCGGTGVVGLRPAEGTGAAVRQALAKGGGYCSCESARDWAMILEDLAAWEAVNTSTRP